MKTPSSLPLLLLLAALPAAADVVPPARCDNAFLDKVVKEFTGVGSIADPRIVTAPQQVNGVTMNGDVLRLGEPKTCDAGTWRHLAAGSPLVWRNADVKKRWDAGSAKDHAALLQSVNEFYRAVDPRVEEVLAASDEVFAAAFTLGVATPTAIAASHVAFLNANSGGKFLADAVKVYGPTDIAPIQATRGAAMVAPADQARSASVTPETTGPTYRKLADDRGAASAGGSAVLRFRMAVLSLVSELAVQGRKNDALTKLPDGFVPPRVDRSVALDDNKFRSALELLVGKSAGLEDATAKAGVLMDPVDIGARNVISVRAEQINAIVAAVKLKLKDTSITEIEASARAAIAARAKPENKLGADVLRRLSETPEYMGLNAMYDNSLRDTSEAGKARTAQILEERNKVEAAALSATVETDPVTHRQVVVYTQGGRKTVLNNIVPESLENDASRNNTAAVIARFIVDGAKSDAKYKALVAALGGEGQPGGSLGENRNQREREVANLVPPAVKNVKAGSQGCEKPGDLIDNDHEIYAARQRERAAEVTSDNKRLRRDIETDRDSQLGKNLVRCEQEAAAAAAIQKDTDFERDASLAARREAAKLKAKEDCDKRRADIIAAATAALEARTAAEAKNNEDIILAQANRELIASFKISVHASADRLRAQYADPKSSRHRQLIADAELSGSSTKLIGYTKYWFDENWPLLTEEQLKPRADGLPADETARKLSAAIDACAAKLGLGESIKGKKDPSYKNPEDPDKIDEHCGVRAGVKKYVSDMKNNGY